MISEFEPVGVLGNINIELSIVNDMHVLLNLYKTYLHRYTNYNKILKNNNISNIDIGDFILILEEYNLINWSCSYSEKFTTGTGLLLYTLALAKYYANPDDISSKLEPEFFIWFSTSKFDKTNIDYAYLKYRFCYDQSLFGGDNNYFYSPIDFDKYCKKMSKANKDLSDYDLEEKLKPEFYKNYNNEKLEDMIIKKTLSLYKKNLNKGY